MRAGLCLVDSFYGHNPAKLGPVTVPVLQMGTLRPRELLRGNVAEPRFEPKPSDARAIIPFFLAGRPCIGARLRKCNTPPALGRGKGYLDGSWVIAVTPFPFLETG